MKYCVVGWLLAAVCCLLGVGCATPEYTVRGTPVPDESATAHEIERTISAYQARDFERQGARALGPEERIRGLPVQHIVDRISHVTERPYLPYRAYLYYDRDPNAAALADGRIYLTTGMLSYLASRGAPPDEFAFVVSHELAHTVAQHLVRRYRTLQQQQLLMALVAAGTAAVTQEATTGVQQAGRLAMDVASMLQDVAESGYSQEQELEADQLGVRYMFRAGFDPRAALDLLGDFSRFEDPWPFLRTHPYSATRRDYLRRYLIDTGYVASSPSPGGGSGSRVEGQVRQLRQTQRLYPVGSISWKNLQHQIEELERRR